MQRHLNQYEKERMEQAKDLNERYHIFFLYILMTEKVVTKLRDETIFIQNPLSSVVKCS